MKALKEKVLSGEAVHGCWVNMGSTVSAEIIGQAGFDWVLIDLEHGAGNDVIMYQQLQALESTAAAPVVRTAEPSRPRVQRILDAGAYGVMFPQIQSADEARQAVSGMYYPPRGIRGVAKMVRATRFGRNAEGYMHELEKNILGIIQIETINALKQTESIAAIDGVDVLFVGPSDLSMGMGIFGQFTHYDFRQAIRRVAQHARKNGKTVGVLLQDITEYEMYYQLGYRFIACGADSSFVVKGAEEMAGKMKSSAGMLPSGK